MAKFSSNQKTDVVKSRNVVVKRKIFGGAIRAASLLNLYSSSISVMATQQVKLVCHFT
ncbi:hypothetical protein [Emticicia agri]|uniref:hypothetical protein n=1 Tax=Emticicia agri TaxID=2492393 RepID=UPI0013ECA226|nr:hypothetical protein [Emticicia agri]